MSKSKYIYLFLILVVLLTSAFTLKWCTRAPEEAIKKVELNYWRVWDDGDAFIEIIQDFQRLHPNVTINYRRLRYEEYEKELLNALAEDRGPDIFSLHNTWVTKYQGKLQPLPKSITLPFWFVKGSIKKETVTELRTYPGLNTQNIRNDFVDVVYQDVVRSEVVQPGQPPVEKIYALPLSVDTMVLYYNVDLLNNAGIPQPPRGWGQFQEQVKRITKLGSGGELIQAGAGIGTSKNVSRASDVLALLMMQNGAKMTSGDTFATFHQIPSELTGRTTPPGEEALRFYTDFANSAKEVYTWNDKMPESLEAFVQGKTAFFFGYAYNLPTIQTRAPKLRMAMAPIPQIEGNPEINFANYWVEGVSQKTKHQMEAWGFIQFAAQKENVTKYLNKTKKPTARRDLIAQQLENFDINIFASQLLTAKSWYRGKDAEAMEKIFADMIDSVVAGEVLPQEAINLAAGQVNQTLK